MRPVVDVHGDEMVHVITADEYGIELIENRRSRTQKFAGLGAGHQTGWTGLVAETMEVFGRLDSRKFLEAAKAGA